MVMVKKERLLTFLNRMNGQGIESVKWGAKAT